MRGRSVFVMVRKKNKSQSLVAFPPWITISFDKLCLLAPRILPAESNAFDLIIYLIWLSWKCPVYQSFCFPTWTIFPLCLLSLSQLGPICPGNSPINFHLMGADPSSIPSVYFRVEITLGHYFEISHFPALHFCCNFSPSSEASVETPLNISFWGVFSEQPACSWHDMDDRGPDKVFPTF